VVRWTFVAETAVAIIGGGISGLSAAHALHRRQVPYLLLEAGPSLGGLIRTETRGGFLLEGGADSIFAAAPPGVALCRELGLAERLVPANLEQRTTYVLHRRRLHPLPEGLMLGVPTRILPFLRSGLFSWPGKLRMGLDLVLPGGNGRGDESIASFVRRRLGQEAVDRLGDPLLAGIHSGDPEQLSILSTFPRLRELEQRHGSLVRGLRATPPPKPAPGAQLPAVFYSLRGGLREMVDALVVRLDRERIWTKAVVQAVSRRAGRFSLAVRGNGTVEAGRVIVAAPGPGIAPALEGLVPGAARALAAIPFASSATVLLGYRREDVAHPLDGYGLVVPRTEGLRTTAIAFVSTKYPFRAPGGHVLLRGYLGGARDGEVMALSDEEMAETVKREMSGVLGLRGRPVATRVFRWPGGTPQLEVGHLERMGAVQQEVASVPGLHLTGNGIRTTGIPDAVADGTRAGETAAEGAR
jgi:protoporphyrinogen/coproporphyrinogen III oxidase